MTPRKECLSVFRSPLNARLLRHRLTIFKVVINIFRILRTLEGLTPVNTHKLYWTLDRGNEVTVGNLSLSNEMRLF